MSTRPGGVEDENRTGTLRPVGCLNLLAIMKPKSQEELQKDNDLLLRLAESANKRADENERIIKLLVAAGIVDDEKIAQAREIAKWK